MNGQESGVLRLMEEGAIDASPTSFSCITSVELVSGRPLASCRGTEKGRPQVPCTGSPTDDSSLKSVSGGGNI